MTIKAAAHLAGVFTPAVEKCKWQSVLKRAEFRPWFWVTGLRL